MADDWTHGDIALCISEGIYADCEDCIEKGKFYTVNDIMRGFYINDGLEHEDILLFRDGPHNFIESKNGDPIPARAWPAKYFIKVTPKEIDEFDNEVINRYKEKDNVSVRVIYRPNDSYLFGFMDNRNNIGKWLK